MEHIKMDNDLTKILKDLKSDITEIQQHHG